MSFNQFSLDPRLLQGVSAAGYREPTPIQQKSLPPAMEGQDLLGLAQTGTGKTAAFVLPILHRLAAKKSRKARALVLAPTRELAEQINQVFLQLGSPLGLRSTSIYGGVGKKPQEMALRRGVDIIVACPGRLLDHLRDLTLDLSGIRTLVLDEADRMFDMGFFPDLRRILTHLPPKRQTLLFSATMPPEVRGLADSILNNPKIVQIGLEKPVKTISQSIYPVPADAKLPMLLSMLDGPASGRVLIFARTRHRVRRLCRQLEKKGFRVASLQGDLSQGARRRAMDGFRDGKFDILVATDIAARGIDVSQISHVINFDIPETAEAYTHRIGRTGRAGVSGEAFTIAIPDDGPLLRDLEKVLEMQIRRCRLEGFDYGDFIPESAFPVKEAQEKRNLPKGSPSSRPRTSKPRRAGRAQRGPKAPKRGPRGSQPSRVRS